MLHVIEVIIPQRTFAGPHNRASDSRSSRNSICRGAPTHSVSPRRLLHRLCNVHFLAPPPSSIPFLPYIITALKPYGAFAVSVMYSERPRPESPPKSAPFENRALLHAVRLVSGNLVKRAGISSRDSTYSSLLSDIWGQSQYATIAVLAARRQRDPTRRTHRDSSREKALASQLVGIVRQEERDENRDDTNSRKIRRRNASRDQLVRILRKVEEDDLAKDEQRLTGKLVLGPGDIEFDAVRRLWGVPQVVFEASGLHAYLRDECDGKAICAFYDQQLWRRSPDARIFNILYWKERCEENDCVEKNGEANGDGKQRSPTSAAFRSISRRTVADVVRMLLTKRRSPFFEKNMTVVIETVLFGINPDPFVDRFRESALREARFFQGIQGYEYSRSFTGALENLQLGKINRMLKDMRVVQSCYGEGSVLGDDAKALPLQSVSAYCSERATLTDRALQGVLNRYVRQRASRATCKEEKPRMSETDFVRMYLALVGSSTDPGLKYWFSVLDQDGDGWVGAVDVAHFYSQRKLESEKRNGIRLADVHCLWIRLCAMGGVSPSGRGLNLQVVKDLSREDREFMMCALLVRRADDGNLINVVATVSEEADGNNNR